MKKSPLVSVIIPTLNEEKYIESTLKSVKNQDYEKYEIIVVDSKSKDSTVRICKRYTDKVFVIEKRGVALARNFGAKNSKGELLLFLDADTLLLPNTISQLVKKFRRKNVVGATCMVLPLTTGMDDLLLFLFFNQFVKISLNFKPKIPGLCCMYRKEVFEKVNGFDEKVKLLEDFDLSERISNLGEIVIADKTFVLTSPRRIEKWGKMNTIRKYTTLYLKYFLSKEKFDLRKYKPIR